MTNESREKEKWTMTNVKMIGLGMVLVMAGCATSAPDRAARAASSLEVMQQNSIKARIQIDTVLSSLDALLIAPADRLRESYDRYAGAVTKMNEYAEAIRENDTDLKRNGNSYLNEWKDDASSVSNPELRAVAEQRRSEIASKANEMRSTVTTATSTFEAFLRDINDVRKVIGNDLTPAGQDGVKSTTIAETAQRDGAQAKTAIENAERAIADLRARITPTGR
jgi:hypothetical protein